MSRNILPAVADTSALHESPVPVATVSVETVTVLTMAAASATVALLVVFAIIGSLLN